MNSSLPEGLTEYKGKPFRPCRWQQKPTSLKCWEVGILPVCTEIGAPLAPKDIRLFRRLRGDVDSMREAPESEEARTEDWRRYKKDCLTPGEAMVLDTNRRQKLRLLLQKRRQRVQQKLRC